MKYIWRKSAEKRLLQETEYCLQRFGKKAALRFIESIDRQVTLLSQSPGIGKREPLLLHRTRHLYRSLVVHKHFKLVYYIDEAANTLYIVALWDTRREPLRQADAT
ncbi:MAG TPA: type II toxin-antitoxin system RelE/ParE family toxin [Candidatus Bacteroides merdipullorum]|uniref:Type II toxin-antitoxin system RelE/ParE family toxin n=1 Tax=Candidatus Bacteroides merdipullorum TaxID=2838474 RepID=A0A9D2A7C3_9BACE|nr:type II toxin-antitoxin system RelE/ParE family toxin [Candidatus Bacteroides merdipullorum]